MTSQSGTERAKARPSTRPPTPPKKLIGQLLLEAGLITQGQLDEALREQKKSGKKVVEVLQDLGYINQAAFERFLARLPGIASLDLDKYQVPPELVELVPKELAIKHQVLPIDKLGKLLTVGMVCPLDTKTIEEIESRTGLRVKPILCSAEDLNASIKRYYDKHGATAGP